MDDQPSPHRVRSVAKKGAKLWALAIALLVFILLLIFALGILVDHFFLAPTHV